MSLESLNLIKKNIEYNNLDHNKTSFKQLNWLDCDKINIKKSINMVIGADIVYPSMDNVLILSLCKMAYKLLDKKINSSFILTYVSRIYTTTIRLFFILAFYFKINSILATNETYDDIEGLYDKAMIFELYPKLVINYNCQCVKKKRIMKL